MDTFEILLNGFRKIPDLDNGKNRFLFPFKGSLEDESRQFLGIPNDERVVYICRNGEYPRAITDRAVYWRSISKIFFVTLEDEQEQVPFRFVTKVRFDETTGLFTFSNPGGPWSISRIPLVGLLESEKCASFAKVLEKAVKTVFSYFDYSELAYQSFDACKYDDALEFVDMAIEIGKRDEDLSDDDSELASLFARRGVYLIKLNRSQEARTDFLIAKDVFTKNNDDRLPAVLGCLSEIVDNVLDRHKLLTEAFDKSSDLDERKDLIQHLNSLHSSSEFKDVFASCDSIAERKVLLAIKNDSQPIPGQNVICLERSVLSSLGMSFPLGHPVNGVAYVAHPTRSNYYVPMNEYEDTIFLEKVSEYCYLLQCLGAKEIDITRLSGKSLSEMNKSKESGEASLGYKLSEFEGNAENCSQSSSDSSKTYEYKKHLSFSPSGAPYVPEDLNWLAIEPRWSRMIDSRLHGNLTHYVEEISTSEDRMLSSSEETDVAAEIKALGAKFKGCINSESCMSSASKEVTKWQISVIF